MCCVRLSSRVGEWWRWRWRPHVQSARSADGQAVRARPLPLCLCPSCASENMRLSNAHACDAKRRDATSNAMPLPRHGIETERRSGVVNTACVRPLDRSRDSPDGHCAAKYTLCSASPRPQRRTRRARARSVRQGCALPDDSRTRARVTLPLTERQRTPSTSSHCRRESRSRAREQHTGQSTATMPIECCATPLVYAAFCVRDAATTPMLPLSLSLCDQRITGNECACRLCACHWARRRRRRSRRARAHVVRRGCVRC